MIPILFGADATSFETNGLGRLSDAKSCTVVEERNGAYELEMEYPRNGIHFSDIGYSKIIVAKPFQNGSLQAFRIYKIERNAKELNKIYARHITYQLSYIPVSKFTADSPATAFQRIKEYSSENNPFTFWTNMTGAGSLTVSAPDSARAILGGKEGSILDHWHGEYEWDNYTVKFHSARGSDKGVTIRYGKNLVKLSQEENIENTVTGLYPYWKNDGQETTAVMDSSDYVGYLNNNVFFEDKYRSKPLPTERNKYYYDVTTKKIYTWDGTTFNTTEIGQYGDGNIDLYDRPVLIKHVTKKDKDEDGNIVTVTEDEVVTLGSFVANVSGEYVLLPTIFKDSHGNAVELTQEQATQSYRSTNQYLGKYNTKAKAESYQKKLELEMKRIYENISQVYTYVELPEKVLYSSNASNFPFKRTTVLDCSSSFQEAPTEIQLRSYTQQYITDNKIGVPKVSLDVEFVDLYGTEGYEDVANLQTVNLCDTVTVEFPELGVSAKEKVSETTYDVLRERYTKIKIGDSQSTLSSTISDQMEQIQYRPTSADMQQAVDRATGVLNSGMRGHVVINRNESGYANEILFLDNDNVVGAKNVLRINMNGIGFSSTGYKGPYYQSWTNDGHLTLGGINNHYGQLTILDENAAPTIELDKTGLKLIDIKYKGYLINGEFYTDPDHIDVAHRITHNRTVGYYDYITSKYYVWNGNSYVQSADAGVLASMTHSGFVMKKGEIDLLGKEDFHFKVNDDGIELGDFKIEATSRQLFMSDDERTGMSGPGVGHGEWYLWADYHNSDEYGLAVNDAGLYCMNSGKTQRFNVGDELEDLRETCISLQRQIDELEPEDPDEPGGPSGAEDTTGEGYGPGG